MGFTFLAFAERERLQARRRKETTPERDARLDDLRERAQARRRRENEHWHLWVSGRWKWMLPPFNGGCDESQKLLLSFSPV